VPYVKISRDKRGYETYYLLEPASDRSRQSRPRLLFWFRTPPQVKVGREPFSEEVRQAIESQNPDLSFDWARLMATSPPPVDVQIWRERRRLERAARQAAKEEAEPEPEVAEAESAGTSAELPIDDVDPPRHSIEAAVDADALQHPDHGGVALSQPTAPAVSGAPASDAGTASPSSPRRRRRRRRGRKHGPAHAEDTAPQPPSTEPPPSSDEV
jgi:hypothetical protein